MEMRSKQLEASTSCLRNFLGDLAEVSVNNFPSSAPIIRVGLNNLHRFVRIDDWEIKSTDSRAVEDGIRGVE